MVSIEMHDDEWEMLLPNENKELPTPSNYRWREYDIQVSPSGRYAAFKVVQFKNKSSSIIYIVDLLTRQYFRYKRAGALSFVGEGFVFYWVTDHEMIVFLENKRTTHVHYHFEVDHVNNQLIERARSHQFISNFHVNYFPENGAICFLFKNKEYLLVSGFSDLLLQPYKVNTEDNAPAQHIVIELWKTNLERFRGFRQGLVFGYKDNIYYIEETYGYIENGKRPTEKHLDRFICIDLSKNEPENGRMVFEQADATYLHPTKIGPGTFKTKNRCSASQKGHIVVITEHFWLGYGKYEHVLKFWILNLEKVTIQERLVTSDRLIRVTLYQRDLLMLWSVPDHEGIFEESTEALKCKLIPRTDMVSSLKAICTAKILLSNKPNSRERIILKRLMFR